MRHKRTVRVARQVRDAASIAKYIIGSLWIGWGTWIRTKTNRVRVCCATVTPFPNGLLSKFNSLRNRQAIAPWRQTAPAGWPPFYPPAAALGKGVTDPEDRAAS